MQAGQLTAAHNLLCCAWICVVCRLYQHTNEDSALCVSRTACRSATSKAGSAVTPLTYIWGGHRLETRQAHPLIPESFRDFYWIPIWKSRKMYLEFGRDSFLPYPCQFTIYCNSVILRFLAWFVNIVVCALLRFLFRKNLQHNNKEKKDRREWKQRAKQSRSKRPWRYRSVSVVSLPHNIW